MKKLTIVLAAVAIATYAQAAAFSWKTSATGKVYEPGTTTLLASSTAYLFDATTVTQTSLVEAFAGGSLDLATKAKLSSASISNGAIATTGFSDSTAAGGSLTAYFASVVTLDGDDYLFISAASTVAAYESSTSAMQFNAKAASQAAAMQASGGYAGAGWYAVPEPTSGLLMLLGMAGLALRRHRA